jgi:predicted secreted hydrolase
MPRRKFYFEYKDAVRVRDKTAKELKGKTWKPFNSEVVDIKLSPNQDKTYHLELHFENGEMTTLYEFLEANKLHVAFLEIISN